MTYTVRRDRLVVALEGIHSLGVAQCPPLVPLVCVSLGKHLQFVCYVFVVIISLGLGRLGADPLS